MRTATHLTLQAPPAPRTLADRLRAAVSLAALFLVWLVVLIPSAIWFLGVLIFNRESLRSDGRG